MASMSVRPEQLYAMAESVATTSKGIERDLEELNAKVARLRASWDGSAKEAYEQAQARWTQQLQALQGHLAKISQAANQISTSYVDTDRKAASLFGG